MVAVLLANAGIMVASSLANDPGDVAGAAVALASTAEPAAALDPLSGILVQVPLPTTAVDPNSPLPTPENPPANARAATPEVRHGTLEIPKIGLSQPFFEGVTLTAIDRGPSHWPGTAMPGQVGNVVIAGHRTTKTKPFYRMDELVPGDELIFTMNDGSKVIYVLDQLQIVQPTDIHIVQQTAAKTATLFACHPRGSARQRIVGHFVIKPPTMPVEFFDTLGGGSPITSG